MTIKLDRNAFYDIRAPQNFCSAMRKDVKLLFQNAAYTTCTTVVLCCIDALSAGNGDSSSRKFKRFVSRNFPVLCAELERLVSKKQGAEILYERFRHGLAHVRSPRFGFAIADNTEMEGRYAAEVQIEGFETFIAVNAERLINDFLELLDRIEQGAA